MNAQQGFMQQHSMPAQTQTDVPGSEFTILVTLYLQHGHVMFIGWL